MRLRLISLLISSKRYLLLVSSSTASIFRKTEILWLFCKQWMFEFKIWWAKLSSNGVFRLFTESLNEKACMPQQSHFPLQPNANRVEQRSLIREGKAECDWAT